jgi:hypothetical protein
MDLRSSSTRAVALGLSVRIRERNFILAINDAVGQEEAIMFAVRNRLIAALSICYTLALITAGSAQSAFQPPRGSQLRTQLLDAARPVFERETNGSIELVVRRLNVLGDWAFGDVHLQRPGGGQIDWRKTKYADDFSAGMFDPGGSFFLLRRTGTIWKVMEYSTGPTDVVWDG